MSQNISNMSTEDFKNYVNDRFETIQIVIEELKKTKEEDPNKSDDLTSNERTIVVALEQTLSFTKELADKLLK